ncbi:MAG: DUF4389 domain-containing protein [Acidimicrobiales bacterium]
MSDSSLPDPPAAGPGPTGGDTYPAGFTLDAPTEVSRWRALFQWVLAIPQLIIANALASLGWVIGVVSWFIILFTGKLPSGLADVQAMILRYNTRAMTYSGFLYEDYPPFDFNPSSADPGGSPMTQWYEPELEDRNRVTVAFRFILAIPHMVLLTLLWIATMFVWFAAFFAVLFTAKWPDGMRNFVIRVMNYGTKVGAYLGLLTDKYPPFTLD